MGRPGHRSPCPTLQQKFLPQTEETQTTSTAMFQGDSTNFSPSKTSQGRNLAVFLFPVPRRSAELFPPPNVGQTSGLFRPRKQKVKSGKMGEILSHLFLPGAGRPSSQVISLFWLSVQWRHFKDTHPPSTPYPNFLSDSVQWQHIYLSLFQMWPQTLKPPRWIMWFQDQLLHSPNSRSHMIRIPP